MKVADLMQADVRTISRDAAVKDAVLSLADGHVSALPVVDGLGHMVGVVSNTDVIAAEAEVEADDEQARETLFQTTPVRDIMTSRTLTIGPEADVRDAARQMLYADVHRLFVVVDDQLVGVISTTDIVRAVSTGRL